MGAFKGFSQVKLTSPQKSMFDLTHDRRQTINAGVLAPILCMEAVPSERFRGNSEILMRLAPMLAPIYDQIQLYVHYFFVPNRLLWDEWEEFITGGRLGPGGTDPVAAPIPPRLDIGLVLGNAPTWFDKNQLPDYLGVPVQEIQSPNPVDWEGKFLDMMPFAAYNLVWGEYYRDRNFIADDFGALANIPMPSGTMAAADAVQFLSCYNRAYRPDYFTSALPFTQRGEEVLLPVSLGGNAPLYANPPGYNPGDTVNIDGVRNPGAVPVGMAAVAAADPGLPGGTDLWVRGEDFDGTSTSINDFRSAYALQVWLERNAVGGSRYTESTQAHFNVRPQDSRLQRPEYIGGGRISVKISEVLSTAWSENDGDPVPLANMAGHGITYGNTNQFSYFCAEHGFIIGIASILSPSSYQQGLPRMFKRGTFLDYPWPTFAKLGEQPVYDWELYLTPANLTPDSDGEYPVFGYQSRYADWKDIRTSNHGDFRDTSLFWTLTRIFEDTPVLGNDFILYDSTIVDRIFAVQPDSDHLPFWLYIHNNVRALRPLPYFGVPNTLGFV